MKESSEDTASATSLQIPKTSLTFAPGNSIQNLWAYGQTVFNQGQHRDNLSAEIPGCQVFQVTMSKDHSLNPEGMKNILIAAGILTMDGEKTIEVEQNVKTIEGEQNVKTIEGEQKVKMISFY